MIVLPAGIAEPSEGLDFTMLLGSLVIVFGTMGLLGMIRPDSGPRQVEKRMRVRKKSAPTKKVSSKPIDEDEDIHLEAMDEEPEPLVEIEPENEELDELPEEKTSPVDEFEARLQRLRERREKLGGK